MVYEGSTRRKKFYAGSAKIKKMYLGSSRIYSAGSTVTWYVDSGTSYTEEVDSEASCLSPTTFTPSKSGYTFVGWREDTMASSSVLSSKVMGDEAVTLYAVFSKTITLTYYNGSSTAGTNTGKQYYNCGNITNPTFTLSAASVSGFSFVGWCTSSSATADVVYSTISGRSFDADATVYAKYSATITLTYYANSSTASTATGTRYYNSGNYSNPTFTISSPSVSGWTFAGWCTSSSATASVAYSSISSTSFSASTTIYAKFSQTITLSYNGNSSTSGSVSSQTGTRYWNAYGNYNNPSFTLASNGFTKTSYTWVRWASGSASGTQYAAGASVTLSASTVFYAYWVLTAKTFSYTGDMQSYTIPWAGTYKLEVYGAQGGSCTAYYSVSGSGTAGTATGGKGGYAYGSVTLSKGAVVYVCVGGQPSDTSGGYNGGGSCAASAATGAGGGSGGGCTHMASATGTLKSLGSSNKSKVYIVAGGGGGAGAGYADASSGSPRLANGGTGGGTSGGYGYPTNTNYDQTSTYVGTPGTQSAAGSSGTGGFGYGASESTGYNGGAGGGGLYGGGYGPNYNGGSGGGGGSGYTGGVSSAGMTNGSRSGNGYACITLTSAA